MTTYTVAQALATSASGILVVDTAANIANNLSNASLVSRVTLFSMSGNGAVSASQAAALAGIGSKFSKASYTLTERDTVAQLTAANNAAGLTISGIVVAVQDTAANILAAASNSIIRNASSIALTANATLTLAQLLTLESWHTFTATGLTLTLSDSAANLLAFTPAEAKSALTVFQVGINSTVTAAQAITLAGMSHFGIASNVTLTIADTVSNMLTDTSALSGVFLLAGVAVNFSDTLSDLLTETATVQWFKYPNVRVTLSASATAMVSQAATLAALPNFGVASGQGLTISDTVVHLVTLTGSETAIASAITLSGNDTASAAQLVILAALPHFSPGYTLTVDDTLVNLATLTTPQRALATAETIDDTVSHLLAAQPSALSGATTIIAELDGVTLDANQATALAALAAHATLTLHANGTNTTLSISDSASNLSAAAAGITTLEADGPVSVVTTGSSSGSILSASAAAALVQSDVNPASGIYAVADTGSALAAVAGQIFGQGFEAITVTSGTFSGTKAQLLDPTLHFLAGSSAQLDASAVSTAAQALQLAALPGFSLAASVTLVVEDSITDILAAAATLPGVATSILANDTETVSAAAAATLAGLTGFSLHGNFLILEDTAANLATATQGAIALATNVDLASDARISEATALLFVAMGLKFSPNGFFITLADTATNLAALANSSSALAVVNSWAGEAVLSANATVTVANAAALSQLAGFNVGTHQLTIGDSASNLLGAGNGILALAYAVQISQASTVTAADAATLEALRNFSANGLLTIADTPADLAAMAASLATPASNVSLVAETGGNASGYAVNATQFAAMLALPHFSLAGFGGTVAVTDTATALAALAPSLSGLTSPILSHITMTLSTSATVTVGTAETLHGMLGFGVGTSNLTISDTATNLTMTLDAGTALLASTIEVNAPATMTVAAAATLAALHNFTTDANTISIADTPANLAAQSAGVAAIAATETILPYSGANAADYTLDTTQFLDLIAHPVSFTGFAGPLIVQGTALDLASLAGAFIGAALGSTIIASRNVLTTELTASATVNSQTMGYLIGLPGFSLNSYSLILQDTPSALLSAFSTFLPDAHEVELAANGTAWVVTSAQAAQLAAIGPLNAGPAGMIVSDTVADLLTAPYATGIAAATATTLDADATITVAQADALHALPNFSRGAYSLTISDTAGNIATLTAPIAALASAIVTIGSSSSLSVSAFNSMVDVLGFSGSPDSLTVTDTASQLLTLVGSAALTYVASTVLLPSAALTLAEAVQLSSLPNLQTGDYLAIADSAADLLHITGNDTTPDNWTITLEASSVTLTANALLLTAAQATLLAQLGSRFSNGGFTLTIQDNPTALLGLTGVLSPIAAQISSVTLAGGTWPISIAQAEQLDSLHNFSSGTASVAISDSVANLVAAVNNHLISGIVSDMPNVTFTLAANDTAWAAQAQALYELGGAFSRGSSTLTIIDGATHLASLGAGAAALASSIELAGNALTTVANFQAIRALPNYSNNGNLLIIVDTAAHLLELANTDVSLASEIMLSTSATGLTGLQAEQLATLANFTTGIARFTIVDSAADLLQLTGENSLPDDWAGEVASSNVMLNASAIVTAAQAEIFSLLGSRFNTGGYTLTVSDSAANLLSNANAAGLALAGAITLSGNETALSTAAATLLAALSHFSKGGYTITVSDLADDLALPANAAGLALADHVQLSQAGSMTVVAAEALIGLANFQVNNAAPITIADTLTDLLGLASADLAHNNSVLATTSIELSASAVATVAQIEALAALAQYSTFSLNGNAITVEDSGRHLAGIPADTITFPATYVMIGDATLDAAQASVLAGESVEIGDNTLTVADTPTALLGLSAPVNAIATGLTLSGAAPATAAQATELEALAAEHRFSTGGYALTVTGSASALLALSTPTQQLATTLALSESGDVVSVANLVQLAELGGKFSLAGNTMTVSDSAAQLATLNGLETALVSAAVLDATPAAPIDTTTATELAALPDFSLGNGVTLTVEGTYDELQALPGLILSLATLELTGSAQTLTAAEAASLGAQSNFSPSPGVIVQDTIANLTNDTGWQVVATGGYIVTDSVSNLLANPSSPLFVDANSVTLLGDAQVNAAEFATLANIANFSRGTAALTVVDGPVAIADNATEIALLASSALVDAAAPVSAAQAESLATLNAAHMLSFTGGISLAVQDSFGNLTSAGNAAGLALASTITVLGTGAQLAAATAHDWGTALPYYELNMSGDISGSQATTLHGLGGHYLPESYTLTVVDNAAGVAGNATAIQALGIDAEVSDSVAGVDAEDAALGALGSTLQSVTLTDMSPVLAATAAGLVPLVAKLTGPAITVADSASAVDTYLTALETLGTHLSSVAVTDSAGQVGDVASDLATLAGYTTLTITLTDATTENPVSADVADTLVPVAGYLGATSVNVSAPGAQIAADATTLAELGTALGTVTLSDGTTTDAATAAALVPIESHLGFGVMLSVADTAAAIAGAADGLAIMLTDLRISGIAADGESAADIATYGATLATLGATATISDSAAHVSTYLDALEALSHANGVLTQVTLTGGITDISVTLHQITADADVLGLISGSFKYAITDSSAHIADDLGMGEDTSQILALGAMVDTIAVSDLSDTLTLPDTTLFATGVDDGPSSALTKLVPDTVLAVSGMTIADFANLDTLTVAPSSFAVAASNGAIQGDLLDHLGSSVLLANLGAISGIVTSGLITLDYATASAAHVNDGDGSVFSLMSGETLDVTGVPATDVASVFTTGVAPASITVVDSAAGIATDLETTSPALVHYSSQISSITVSPSGAISLDADHAVAAGVDGGIGSVFGSKMTGGSLTVTGALITQLDDLHGLYLVPSSVAVSDDTTLITDDLQLGASSKLETYAGGMLTAVTSNDGPVVLDDSYVSAVTAALALLPTDSLQVTNVPVANISSVADLYAFASMTVTDSATDIANDNALDGASQLAQAVDITSVTVTGGPIMLTETQALDVNATALARLPSASVEVTGVAVDEIASVAAAIGSKLAGMTITDSASDITNDLQNGTPSELTTYASKITSVTLTDTTPVLAAVAAGVAPLVGKLTAHAIPVADSATNVDTYLSGLETMGSHLNSVTVTDTAAQVGAVASDLATLAGYTTLSITLSDATTENPVSADVADTLVPVAGYLGAASVNVSAPGAQVAADATTLAELGTALGTVTLSDGTTTDAATAAALVPIESHLGFGVMLSVADTAAAIAGAADGLATMLTDLRISGIAADGESAADIVIYGATLATLGATATISDSAAHVSTYLDALEALSHANGVLTQVTLTGGITDISVTLHQITADADVLGLISGSFKYAITDSSAHIADDLGMGEDTSQILALGAMVDTIAVSDLSDTLTLPDTTLFATGVDDGPSSALTKLVPDTVLAVSGMTIADFANLDTLTVAPSSFAVAASNGAIQGDLLDHLGSSVLLANLGAISGIVTSGLITLDYATASAAHVNDGDGSVFSLMSGETLDVTGVPATDVASVFTTGVAPASITVVDSAAGIATDLETTSPALVHYSSQISSITVSPSGAVTLDADHALVAGVDSGIGSVFGSKMTGGSLTVTGALITQLDDLHGLYLVPASVAVSDDTTLITDDLQLGASSKLETYAGGMLTAVASNDGPVVLDDSYVSAVTAALALLPTDSLQVTNVPVANISSVADLYAFASMTVTDSATDIANDNALDGASQLAQAVDITSVTVTGGPIMLTETQALDVNATALARLPAGSVEVTGVTVAEIAGVVSAIGSKLAGMTITDSASDITTDLQNGTPSELTTYASKITSVTLTDTTPVLAAVAAGVAPLVGKLTAHAIPVADSATNVDTYLSGLETMGSHLNSVTVTDTAAQVGAVASDLATLAGYTTLSITLSDATTENPVSADVADTLVPVAGYLGAASVNVSAPGAQVAADATTLAELGTAFGTVTLSDADLTSVATVEALTPITGNLAPDMTLQVSDTEGNIHSDLISDTSALEAGAASGLITAITVTGSVLSLTDLQAEAVLPALRVLGGTGVTVTGVLVADIAGIAVLPGLHGMTVSDDHGAIRTDLLKGASSELYLHNGSITSVTVTGGTVDLPYADIASVESLALDLLPSDTLQVDDVPLDQVTTMVDYPGLFRMTVSDDAGVLQTSLEAGSSSVLQQNYTVITGIAIDDGGTITLEDSAATPALNALALLTGSDVLVVNDVMVGDVYGIAQLTALSYMTVSDSTTDIHDDLINGGTSFLEQYYEDIQSISFSSGTSVTLTGGQAALVMDALAELPASSLSVTGVAEAQVAALGSLAALTSMSVSDSAGHIQTDLALGAASPIEQYIGKISSIAFSGTVTLDYLTAASHVMSALAKLPADGQLIVDAVPVANISTIAGLVAVLASMTVSDSGGHVETDLNFGADSVIETNVTKITAISLTGGSVTLEDSAADLVTSALSLLPSGSLTVDDVPVGADITTFYGLGAMLAGMTISDIGGTIETDLTSGGLIEGAISKITAITVTSGSVALTDGQANAVMSALELLSAGSVTISAVPLGDVATFAALTAVSTMAVYDSGTDIGNDLAEVEEGGTSVIASNLGKISGITLSGGSVTLTDAEADDVFSALAKLPAGSLTVTGVPLGDVAHIASLGAELAGMTVLASASAVQTDLVSGSVITSHASDINSISLTDGSGQVTLTDGQADAVYAVLDKLPGSSLVVTGVPTTDVGHIAGVTPLSTMTVADAGGTIATDLGLDGSSVILNNLTKITSVTTTDASLTASVAAAIYHALGSTFIDGALVISDTATNILAAYAGLGGGVLAAAATVELSTNATGLTAAQATTLAGILHGASNGYTVNVADTAANLLSGANSAGIALAATVGVSDTAADILASAPLLIAMEPQITSTTITDSGPLSAAAVSDLLALPNLSAGALTIADTGSQIAAAIELNGATGVAFLEAHSVQLSGNSIIVASDAAALEQLGGSLNKEGFTISVSDTAAHLTDTVDGYLAAVSDTTLVNGVYLKTTGGTVTVTASVGAALIGIPNFHKNPVGGGTNILIVQDTATHFDASYGTLATDLGLFDHLYLSTSASVTDAVYAELLGLGVQRANAGVTVTVRDTASNIASNATGQLGSTPSITPVAWQLSASATVSESQAAVLGGLSGFSTGIYTLTLSPSAAGVSVGGANALGALGSALHLGTSVYVDVTGSVATLSGLTGAALAIVTPQISDLFSNIAQMSPGSPLLNGTMTVTDSEAITVAQATDFFALVKMGSGSGIPAGNITFNGGAETITDTLTNVQTLTSLSSWTSNASLHTDFHLEVADTVATLINPANTSALSGMSATTLSGNQTATAANLETLFTLENTIHFSLGANVLTIQDTAADLLNPSYSDAVAIATSLTLLGPDTVVAADAETLMATGKLLLTGSTILTISDTSSDLLDGVLGPAISNGGFTNFVHVELSDQETLDADTAEALVSLPGYTAVPNALSIVDGVSYLLNPADHQAEVDATSVTLDGDAYVSAATAVQLVGLPNFALDGNTLYLASNDYADAATLTTLADLGSGFNLNGNILSMTQNALVTATQLAEIGDFGSGLHVSGHTLTLTQDALALTPAEYTAVQSDSVVLSGHALSAIPSGVTVSEVSGNVEFDGTGVSGATVTLYAADGSVVSTTSASPGFTVSAAESGSGINVAVTETVNGTESAPIIALEQTILTNAATADGATFATSGQVQVGTNEYMNLYTAGSQPASPANPVLVYDPAAHTLSFDAAGHSEIVLLTLGTATHPASLDPSEIFVKHYVA